MNKKRILRVMISSASKHAEGEERNGKEQRILK